MKNNPFISRIGNMLSTISICIPMVIFILILNWFFKITPYQKLQGLPLMISIFVCPIAIILGIVSSKISNNRFWKIGVIFNLILFFLPFLYWFFGTLIFGV